MGEGGCFHSLPEGGPSQKREPQDGGVRHKGSDWRGGEKGISARKSEIIPEEGSKGHGEGLEKQGKHTSLEQLSGRAGGLLREIRRAGEENPDILWSGNA